MSGAAQNDASLILEELESRIAPASDLIATVTGVLLPDVTVPGDTGTVFFEIKNVAAALDDPKDKSNHAIGKTGFHVYLSANQTLDGDDVLLGKAQNKSLNIAPGGGSKFFNAKITMPLLELDGSSPDAGNYYILVQADSGQRIDESQEGNNIGASAETVSYQFQFGEVGTRKGVVLKGLDQGDKPFWLKLTGGGLGTVSLDSGVDINLTGTTNKSTASSNMVGGLLNDITAGAALKALSFPGAFINGDVTLSGGAETVFLGNTGGTGAELTIGGSKVVKTLTLGRVSDLNINVPAGIASLSVIDWNAVGADTITAPFILSLKTLGASKVGIAGNFDANLTLSGAGALKGLVVGKAMIAGSLLGGTWDVGGSISSIAAVSGDGWKLDAEGGVGAVVMKGAKSLPGSLSGDKSQAGFTLQADYFKEITITGVLDGKIVTTGADEAKLSIKDFLAKSVVGGSVIDADSGTVKDIEVGEWLGGGSLSAKGMFTLVTNKKFGSGDFEADLFITDDRITEAITIAGALRDAEWALNAIGSLKIARLFDSNVHLDSVKTLQLGNAGDQPAFGNSFVDVAFGIGMAKIWNVDESDESGAYGIRAESAGKYIRYAGKNIADTYFHTEDFTGIADTVGKYEFEIDD